jgi:flagellar biosynthesis chaperone FliJ
MHRLPLILCALALLGSSASAVLYFRIGNSKQVLESRLADADARTTKLDAALAAVTEQTGALKGKISALDADLERTNTKLAGAESRAAELDRELALAKSETAQARTDAAQTRSVVALYESTAKALADEITELRQDLTETRASHASPEAVQAYKNTIADLERQLASARNGAAATNTAGGSTAVFTSRLGRATVLTVGPESAFVVLNFGSARGAELGQKLNVSQGNSIVATVLISDVRTNFSVAQVLPDTLRGVLQKGDLAVLLR